MRAALARACGEFTVSRRVPWEDDDGLRPHIDRVVDSLRDHDVSAEIEIDADLQAAHVTLTVVVVVGEDEVGESVARTVMGEAIRSSAGRHDGLFGQGEESRLEVQAGRWSGLKTPKWALHNLKCERFDEE
ncbi:MAG: hypothetical protein ABFR89_03005 [Actinomycetota bacterium]